MNITSKSKQYENDDDDDDDDDGGGGDDDDDDDDVDVDVIFGARCNYDDNYIWNNNDSKQWIKGIDNACKNDNTHNYSKHMFSYVTHVRMITLNTTSGNIHLKYQL